MASLKLFIFSSIFTILINFAIHITITKAQGPNFLYFSCSTGNLSANSTYQHNLRTLYSALSSKASDNKTEYYNATIPINRTPSSDTVYGMFMCRGDIPSSRCSDCVQNATQRLANRECKLTVEGVIWYDECLVRYSGQYFFASVATEPKKVYVSPTNMIYQGSYNRTLFETLNKTADEAAKGAKRFATEEADLPVFQKLYCMAQCTPDLSVQDCRRCLDDSINRDVPQCCGGREGARVLYPSCFIRFEIYTFFGSPAYSNAPTPSPVVPNGENKKNKSRTIIVFVVPIVIVMTLLFAFSCYLVKKRARKSYKNILKENFGHESAGLEGLQFDLDIIKAATNNFSDDNMIGKGGFGEVYKGILSDGRHVAIKRLSTSSRQGAKEFKNEILLITKLQHRNLVAFIGFCLEEQEKALIYEYVPNRSLDYHLFGDDENHKLSWADRYKIIRGTALGVLYLHEYSRLKVIHRDLKPSNILLDENMNPKISDFDMARIVEINQDKGETNRIVGTFFKFSFSYIHQLVYTHALLYN